MRKTILTALAALSLLAACKEQASDEETGEAAANSAPGPAPVANGAAPAGAAPLGAALSGEAAKRLMHDRHERMEEIGDALKIITRELKADTPDLAQVRQGAGTISRLAPQVSVWFPPGTGPDVGKTEAKAEIWQKPQDFVAKTRAFQQATKAFNAAAQGNDLAAIRAAYANLGKSCKACHDPYREEH